MSSVASLVFFCCWHRWYNCSYLWLKMFQLLANIITNHYPRFCISVVASMCVIIWPWRVALRVKHFWHTLHWNSFTPLCSFICRFRLDFVEKYLPHTSHGSLEVDFSEINRTNMNLIQVLSFSYTAVLYNFHILQ